VVGGGGREEEEEEEEQEFSLEVEVEEKKNIVAFLVAFLPPSIGTLPPSARPPFQTKR
jgi:hypothetical protein